jgi:integrator complex subunit 11
MNKDFKVEIIPLGAGQEVGRSCIFVSFNREKNILLDCGVHMGYSNIKKYPNFKFLKQKYKVDDINKLIDCLLLSHFHLDHCAALPFLIGTENFDRPIITSQPTKAILPFMLKDFSRVTKDRVFEIEEKEINKVNQLVQTLGLGEQTIFNDIKIKMYYAGHVLGAVMFLMEYKGVKVLYTGDYNSAADRHLAALQIDACNPDIVITESTYATVMKQWKKQREMQFMSLAKRTLERQGKVLIPVFALGRAQELMILIDDLWNKTGWTIPVYYSGKLVERVQFYYKLFLPWTNENIQKSGLEQLERISGFTRFSKLDKGIIHSPIPMVILATPGMLHAGQSLELFKELCEDSRNSLLIPGYCVKGTFGEKLLSGEKNITIHEKDYNVKMEVAKMSFSAHADSKGITDLLSFLNPSHVVFVHGEKSRMFKLAEHLTETSKMVSHCPANHQCLVISFDLEQKFKKKHFQFDQNGFENNEILNHNFWKITKNNEKISLIEKFNTNKFLVRRKRLKK